MGRKRKTRWRRLSIGEASGNEEEESQDMNGDADVSGNHIRSVSQLSLNNSSHGDNTPKMSSKNSMVAEGYPKDGSNGVAARTPTHGEESGGPGENSHHNNHSSHHHQYHNGHHHSSYYSNNHYNKDRGDGGAHAHTNGGGSYHNGGGHHHGNSNGTYYPNYYQRNSYNNYRNTHYDNRGGGGGGGDGSYQQGGNSDYNYSQASRYGGGRYRKPRPYSSNYYYNNGTSGAQQGDNTNRPSYNQDEYTKITTPRQDVLFKKGYLSQRKPATQSSVDSTSSATTPSASTNGTPDTHSTNGVNSDYSEGYENGETDCGIPPYDDTVYYGPPAEAVFTDPNTGQVYYGQCSSNGEYFDAYPVSSVVVAGYPTAPVYYQLSYPPMDWNGVPNPFVPVVAAPALPAPDDQLQSSGIQGAESMTNQSSKSGKNGEMESGKKVNGESTRTSPPPLASSPNSSPPNGKPAAAAGGKENGPSNGGMTKRGSSGSSGSGSFSSVISSSSSPSSLASTPMSPPSGGPPSLHHQHHSSLSTSMSNLSLNATTVGSPSHLHHHPHVLPHFLATAAIPPPGPQSQPQHPFLYQHPPTGFVYAAPPIYNGVVVPIAPTASAPAPAASSSLELVESSSNSRKKRKKRRRKKDGQLTDESSGGDEDDDTASTLSNHEEDATTTTPESTTKNIDEASLKITPDSEEEKTKGDTEAKKKDLTSEEESNPDPKEELVIESSSSISDLTIETPTLDKPTDNQEVSSDKDENAEGAGDIDNSNSTGAVEPENSNQVVAASVEVDVGKSSTVEESSTSSALLEGASPTPASGKGLSLRKPADLTVLCPFNSLGGPASQDLQLLSLQRSPDGLEPSSPDSLNTNQSVAGSEIASVSESDFMNRTTSLDEVEEDLPVEGSEEIETKMLSTSAAVQSNISDIPEERSLIEKDESTTTPQNIEDDHSSVVKKDPTFWEINTPNFTPSESTEPSPSPETIFERQIEPPLQLESEPVTEKVPDQPILDNEFRSLSTDVDVESPIDYESCVTLESQSTSALILQKEDELELGEILEPVVEKQPCQEAEEVAQDQPQLEPEPPDIPEPPIIKAEAAAIDVETVQRPTSITLAVSEWLKAQGDDALTPVSQLQAQLVEAEEGDGDDEEDDDESLQASDLVESEQNQKNVHGNPWVVPSNKSGATGRKGRLTGLKGLRGKDNVSVDGICSRVACRVSTTTTPLSSMKPMATKSEQDGDSRFKEKAILTADEDSGLEHSSPESSPVKKYREEKSSGVFPFESTINNQDEPNSTSDISCDPQKYAKYYQFGVVFDEKDQGIEIDLDEPNLNSDDDKDKDNQIKPMNDKFIGRKVMLTCDLVEDEEVGTFVPKVKKFESISNSSKNERKTRISDSHNANSHVQMDKTVVAAAPDAAAKGSEFSHLYVNPFPLATEMRICEVGIEPPNISTQDFSWDDDDIPLPPYESPSPVEYPPPPPVFSRMTPKAKLIQTHQDQLLGSLIPIPRAICCVIQ